MTPFKLFAFSISLAACISVTFSQYSQQKCLVTIFATLMSPDAACLNGPGAAYLISSLTAYSDMSIVDAAEMWIEGVCTMAPCQPAALTNVVTTLTSSCNGTYPELFEFPVEDVVDAYSVMREIACLQNTNADKLCAAITLETMEKAADEPLSPQNLQSLSTDVATGKVQPNLLGNITCSSCSKATWDVLAEYLPVAITAQSNITAVSACGQDFIDGQWPSDITVVGQS